MTLGGEVALAGDGLRPLARLERPVFHRIGVNFWQAGWYRGTPLRPCADEGIFIHTTFDEFNPDQEKDHGTGSAL